MGYTLRFKIYAKSNGNMPGKQIVKDMVKYPGGVSTGYINWLSENRREFKLLCLGAFLGDIITNHDLFDKWLKEKYKYGR